MTYQEPAVIEAINSDLVSLQVNVKEDYARPVIERYRQVWTPDLRVLGADGFAFYHWNGYLPPFEFLPQLLVAHGQARLCSQDFTAAASLYQEVLRRFPTSEFAAEAQYFLAVAKYKATGNLTELHDGYGRLQSRYPNSLWRVKQSYTE